MIIRDLDVKSIAVFPSETQPKLIINPDAELAHALCLQSFEVVTRRNPQIVQSSRGVQ
jgi:hypothetical protein